MKVTVCFNDAKVVVPCGNGSNTVQHLINEAYQRYKKIILKTKDFSKLDVNDLKLNLKDGGILDPDDEIADVIEDKEQILASFDGIQENSNNVIKDSISLDLLEKIQDSSPIKDNIQNDNLNVVEDLINEDVYCYVTAEDLQSNSHLHVRNNSGSSINMANNLSVFADENSNETQNKNNRMSKRAVDGHKEWGMIDGSLVKDEMPVQTVGLELISLKNDSPLLGIHVMPEYDKQDLMGLRVRSIERDGLADKDGRLRCGDVIVEINNVSLYKVDFAEAQEIFKCARNDRELRLKVMHKGGGSMDVISEEGDRILEQNNSPTKEEEEVFRGGSSLNRRIENIAQQRNEYASMTNLSCRVKESHDTAPSYSLKSVSMNDLTSDNFCHNKIYSSFTDDDRDDAFDNRQLENSTKFKEIFSSNLRFGRSNAYDSLNKAVDKSIDRDADVKDEGQRIFKSVKPNSVKKQHWWSRLKLNKKSKDDSKKKKENLKPEASTTTIPTVANTKSPQPEIITETDKINLNNNNNNNNNVINNNNIKDDNHKDKQTIEWMYRASWLGSTSDSLTSQTNSPAQMTCDINQLEEKINNKGKRVKSPDKEFLKILDFKAKLRSKSAAKTERNASKETHNNKPNDNISKQKSSFHQNQSKSYNDLTSKGLQNEHNLVPDRNHLIAGHRGISHYKMKDYDRPQNPKVLCVQCPPPCTSRNDPNISGRPSYQGFLSSSPNPHIIQENLFRGQNHPQPESRRLADVLKESPHFGYGYSPDVELNYQSQKVNRVSFDSFHGNQSQIVARNSSAFSQVQNPKHNRPYPSQNLLLMPTHLEMKSNNGPMSPVADGRRGPMVTINGIKDVPNRSSIPIRRDRVHRTTPSQRSPASLIYNPQPHRRQLEHDSSRPYHHHPMHLTNHIHSYIPRDQLKALIPFPPISDHLLHHRSDYRPHQNITLNTRNIRQLGSHKYHHHHSPQPQNQRSHHIQQSSDLTDRTSTFVGITPRRSRDSYDDHHHHLLR